MIRVQHPNKAVLGDIHRGLITGSGAVFVDCTARWWPSFLAADMGHGLFVGTLYVQQA